MNRLLAEQGAFLIQSTRFQTPGSGPKFRLTHACATFRFDGDLIAQVRTDTNEDCDDSLTAWSPDREAAEKLIRTWIVRYRRRGRSGSKHQVQFHLIQSRNGFPCARKVSGFKPFALDATDLALHYGRDFPFWEEGFVRQLRSEMMGAVILTGDPGTGKTSFIRHLIHKLRRSHRFYYIPVETYPMVCRPGMVEFWLNQQEDHPRTRLVLILEDAESLLMTRGPDNVGSVSNILNTADGLLGESLRLQLICTINCKVDQLDPAVLRVGRLIGRREFRRLEREDALKLAAAKGLTLPHQQDYSLAEVYAAARPQIEAMERDRLGFGFAA
ncbi:MAG: AAA family ATPase [Verrucomicrobiia bacterium]